MRPTDVIEARERLGLTQSEVGDRARVSEGTVSRIERGIRVRPNSLKDVYAVLNLPYSPLDTTILVMPERLVGTPSTEAMRQAAETLPHIEYLVRPDPVGWKDHVLAAYSADFLSATRRYPMFAWFAAWCLLTIVFVGMFSGLVIEGFTRGFAFGLVILFFTSIVSVVHFRSVLAEFRQIRTDFVQSPDLNVGYAMSEDAIWKLTVGQDRVYVAKTPLDPLTRRRVKVDGPFMNIHVDSGESTDRFERLLHHQGIIDLIDRSRRDDRDRVVFLSTPATAA